MNRIFLSILLVLFFSPYIIGQEIETEAPENPEFIKWKANRLKSGDNSGEIPPPVLANHDWLIQETQKKELAFDAVYDLRTQGLITGAKDQGNCGACWTFACIGSLESAFMKQEIGTFDFSEQSIRSCHGFVLGENAACSGGNNRKASAYLTRGDGPLLESNVPYNTYSEASCYLNSAPQFRVYDINYYPNDKNILKQAILDYGALYTNYYNESNYYTSSSNSYYYSGTSSTDHAVLLVGWDDNKTTLGGKGAWIIKNSWGDDWGNEGFFYIAYQDTKINTSPASFQGIESIDEGDILHMYDELGWISSVGYGSGIGEGLVKFTTHEAQILTSIGTVTTASGATIRANIYATKTGDILSDLIATTNFMSFDYSGYHRIYLNEALDLEAEKDFYVQVQYSTNDYNYPIPFEKLKEDYAEPQIESNVAWIRGTGSSWNAVGDDVAGKERDLCIRAYAKSKTSAIDEKGLKNTSIKLFPQPANNFLNIELSADYLDQQLSVISLNGQVVIEQKISSTNQKIELDKFSSGLYLVQIKTNSGKLLEKKRFLKTK